MYAFVGVDVDGYLLQGSTMEQKKLGNWMNQSVLSFARES